MRGRGGKRDTMKQIREFKVKITENKNTKELARQAHFLQEWHFKDNA